MLSRDACLQILRLFYFAKYPWFISACFVVRCILAGSCKDSGKTYALYTINVYRASSEGTKSWTIFRRYSDFDDLHMHLKEKVAINLFIVSLHCFYAVCRYWSRFLRGKTLFHWFLVGSLSWLLGSIYLRLSRSLSSSLPLEWERDPGNEIIHIRDPGSADGATCFFKPFQPISGLVEKVDQTTI